MIATIKLLEHQLINIRSSITRVRNQLSADKVTDLELYRQSKATLKELLKFEKSAEANLAWELQLLEKRTRMSWND